MTTHDFTKMNSAKRLKLTLLRSVSGRIPKHRATLSAMGLRRIGQFVSLPNSDATRGMVRAVSYLIKVEEE